MRDVGSFDAKTVTFVAMSGRWLVSVCTNHIGILPFQGWTRISPALKVGLEPGKG